MGSTFKSCYITLLKTSIGSGALSFPYLFSTYGIISTFFLTIISGGFAVVGLILYVKCAKEIGRDATLSELAQVSMPYTRILVDFSVFLKCFGVSLSYLIISKQLIPPIINTLFQYNINPSVVLIIFLVLVGPFCYYKKIDKLKYTSLCGVICILFVLLGTFYRYKHTIVPDNIKIYYSTPFSRTYLGGFGKFVFSFTCHQNIFSIHSEISNNSFNNMKKLIFAVSLTALSLYLSFGYYNYLLYGQFVKDNIIMNFPNDILATIVRSLYVIVMGVSYPLQVTPCRIYLIKMLNLDFKKDSEDLIIVFVTSLVILLTYLLAISGMNLGIVYSIIGATASTFMCLIFPALFYFNMDIERSVVVDVLGYLSFLFGVFVFSTTIYSVVYFKNK
ncbi:amino acid transporter [Vairimorpha necatrix]|uniref:Amino acid transporter n=1 Tax=Vairimorpha necatrix TaxID=6039 RepID=A0AAX4JED1_9MICR